MSIPHPDTLSNLDPDCRRVLRGAYMLIQTARQRGDADAIASASEAYRRTVAGWADEDAEWARRVYGSPVHEVERKASRSRLPHHDHACLRSAPWSQRLAESQADQAAIRKHLAETEQSDEVSR